MPAPQPRAITPDHGYSGADTPAIITGDGFFPQVSIDAAGTAAPDVNATFRAWLEQDGVQQPISVVLRDEATLDAVIPEGTAVGAWDLVVEGPSGQQGRLADAWTSTATLADHLTVSVDGSVAYTVTEVATVRVQVEDLDHTAVFEPLDVDVVLTAADGYLNATIVSHDLTGAQPLTDTQGLRGTLAADGSATLSLRVDAPDLVTVLVRPHNARSGVAEGTLLLEWSPGAPQSVRLDLPGTPMAAVAGVPFPVGVTIVDEQGNEVVDAQERILLRSECGGYVSDLFTVTGHTTVQVALEDASDDRCPETRLFTLSGPGGTSAPIVVQAGPADHFAVGLTDDQVTAGQPLGAVIVPQDAYDNVAVSTITPQVNDSLGTLAPGAVQCIGTRSFLCTIVPTEAHEGLQIVVADPDSGITGRSGPYDVRPDAPTGLSVEVDGPVVAGSAVDARVFAHDRFGNPVTDWDAEALVFQDAHGDVACAWLTTDTDGSAHFACDFFVADPANELIATSPAAGVVPGVSPAFEVFNGALEDVEIEVATAEVTAGEPLGVTFAGYDAWGNPYVAQADPELSIEDDLGGMAASVVVLGPDGTAALATALVRAGVDALSARQDGGVLGVSPAITVRAGAAVSLDVDVDGAFPQVGAPASVRIGARDAWGNAAAAEGDGVVLAASGLAGPAPFALVGGEATVDLTWTAATLDDRLTAATADLSGEGPRLAAWADCGVAGPRMVADFAGNSEPVACADAGGEAAWSADFSDSTGAPTQFAVRVVDDPDTAVWTTQSTLVASARGVGAHAAHALIQRADGCGDARAFTAWVGRDDGSPTGPLTVIVDTEDVPLNGESTVRLDDVRDCNGDPASGALRVSVDRGDLLDVTPTGSGLQADVVDGLAALRLRASATQGGDATIVARSSSGSALGRGALTLVGDDERPTVFDQSPRGVTSGSVSSVVLTFSEPLLPSTVTPSNFAITGPYAVNITAADAIDAEVRLTLDPAADADAGAWTVSAVSSAGPALRDLAGNKLDGLWSGAAGSYVGVFGAVPDARVDAEGCAVDRPAFRPDGDDGPDAEADAAHLAWSASDAPTSWWVTVDTADGARIRTARVASAGTWTWDGRDDTGATAAPGDYTLQVRAEDEYNNLGAACAASITLLEPR